MSKTKSLCVIDWSGLAVYTSTQFPNESVNLNSDSRSPDGLTVFLSDFSVLTRVCGDFRQVRPTAPASQVSTPDRSWLLRIPDSLHTNLHTCTFVDLRTMLYERGQVFYSLDATVHDTEDRSILL